MTAGICKLGVKLLKFNYGCVRFRVNRFYLMIQNWVIIACNKLKTPPESFASVVVDAGNRNFRKRFQPQQTSDTFATSCVFVQAVCRAARFEIGLVETDAVVRNLNVADRAANQMACIVF